MNNTLNNTTTIVGRVVENAKVRVAENLNQVVTFRIAVDDSYTNKKGERIPRPIFYDIERWFPAGKEVKMQNIFLKGTLFTIQGKVVAKSYINNNEIVQKLGLKMTASLFHSAPKKND